MPDADQKWWRQSLRDAAPYMGLGLQLALSVLLFFFAGWWLDEKFGWTPYGMLVGMAIGLTGGMIKFLRTVTSPEFRKDTSRTDEDH